MKARLSTIKNDMYRVFVLGNADNVQLAKAWFLLAIPVFTIFLAFGHFKY
ncbi:MAG TPA: hypothetical protein VIM77_07240 [Mucilaginibacter sp.]